MNLEWKLLNIILTFAFMTEKFLETCAENIDETINERLRDAEKYSSLVKNRLIE